MSAAAVSRVVSDAPGFRQTVTPDNITSDAPGFRQTVTPDNITSDVPDVVRHLCSDDMIASKGALVLFRLVALAPTVRSHHRQNQCRTTSGTSLVMLSGVTVCRNPGARLFAYGMLVLSGRPRRERDGDVRARDARLSAHEVTLLLAVPSINAALRDELDDLGLAMEPSLDGYHFVDRGLLPLVIVDLGVVAEREDDDELRAFAGRRVRTLAAQRWMRQHQSKRSDTISTQATPELEGYEDFVDFMLDGLTPEEKMMGLAPEHVVLALPTEVLRALSDDYIATLPDDVQREVRARRAR